MVDLTPFQEGINAAFANMPVITHDPQSAFMDVLVAEGFTPPKSLQIDKFENISGENKNKKSAWYIYSEIENVRGDQTYVIGIGTYGDFKTDYKNTWTSHGTHQMNSTEKLAFDEAREQMRIEQEKAKALKHAETAKIARDIWLNAPDATDDHGYLKIKGVRSCQGLKIAKDGNLIIPAAIDGQISTLQFIKPDGEFFIKGEPIGNKKFLSGGKSKGAWFLIEGDKDIIYIVEGYATGKSIHQAIHKTVYIAFNAGNIYEVSSFVKSIYPDSQIIIAGDDDTNTAGNVGRTKAEQAAQDLNIECIFPAGYVDFNDLHKAEGLEAVKYQIEKCYSDYWLDPEEIEPELTSVQAFDANKLLPSILKDWVIDTANRMSCAPDFVAVTAVTALGSIIGAGCGIKPKRFDEWTVCPNLWGMAVSPPSSKKTPAINQALKPLDKIIHSARQNYAEKIASFNTEKLAFDAKSKVLKRKLDQEAKNEDGDMSAVINEINALEQTVSPEPILRRYKTNDATVEKIGEILVQNPKGILVLRDELVGLLSSWEKKGHEGDRAFYLEGWNGLGSYDTDRIGRGSIFIENLCISIIGGTQPDKLLAFLRQTTDALANDGAIQRFQMLVFPDPYKWEYIDCYPDKEARNKVYEIFEHISDLDPVSLGANPTDQFNKWPYFHFSDEAQDFFKNWTTHLNSKKILEEDNKLIAEHLGKYDKLFCALALIFHLVDCVTCDKKGRVSLNAAQMAANWCSYLEGHARRCYNLLGDSTMFSAQHIIQKIKKRKLLNNFTFREVSRKRWSGLKNKQDVQDALEFLEETNWIKGYEIKASSKGGPATTRYKINPKIYDH